MIFKISSSLEFGNIFGNTLSFPMDCELDLSRDYYLIYSNLNVKDYPLDLSTLFNEAFGTHLPLNIIIQSGGFFTFSPRTTEHSSDVVVSDIFPSAPIPPSVLTDSKPVESKTSFWATFGLETSGLFKTLIETGYGQTNSVSEVTLSGTFASGEEASKTIETTEYTAEINNFRLIYLFDFDYLKLKYRFSKADEYYIEGNVTVELFNVSYTFTGSVFSTETALQACIKSESPDSKVKEPFNGLMKGVTFKDLMFGLSYTYKKGKENAKSLIRVQGKIDYTTSNNLTDDPLFTGQIFLDGIKPIVAAMLIGDELNIAAIFNHSIAKGNVWPEKFINLVFHSGSQLYYSDLHEGETIGLTDETFDCARTAEQSDSIQLIPKPNNITYKKGFHVYANFDITILITIELIGTIAIHDNGVEAEVQLKNLIDLWILQLTAPDEGVTTTEAEGPIFRFNSEKSTMGFQSGVRFFNANFGLNTGIDAFKDENASDRTALSGYIKSAKEHPPFIPKGAKLLFTYDSKKGFQIQGWEEFSFVQDILDFAKEVEKYSNSQPPQDCGAIVDFVMNEATETDYKITPRFETEENKLKIVLDGSYTLYLGKGENRTELFTLDFPNSISIPVEKDLSFENFGSCITTAIQGAGESFAKGIIANSEAIAILLAIFAGKKAGKYAASLCCKKLSTDPELPEAASTGASAFAAGGGGAGIIIGIVIGIIGSILGNGDNSSGRHPKPGAPKRPNHLKLSIDNNLVTATWEKVEHLNHYHSKITLNRTSSLLERNLSASDDSQKFTIEQEAPEGVYFYEIESINKGKSSGFQTAYAFKPQPPQLKVSLKEASFNEEDVVVEFSWSEVEHTDTYSLIENGQPHEFLNSEPRTCNILFSSQRPEGEYHFKMSAQSRFYIQTAFTQEQIWTRLPPPSKVNLSRTPSVLNIRWSEPKIGNITLLARITFKNSQTSEFTTDFKNADRQSYITVDISDRDEFDMATVAVRTIPSDCNTQEIPSVWTEPVSINLAPTLSPSDIAKQGFDANLSGSSCAVDILDVYPDITSDSLAIAMCQAGYAAGETLNGLVSSYPSASHQTLIQPLLTAYGKNDSTLQLITQWCYDEGESGQDCASMLIRSFDSLTPAELTDAMANSGYLADQARDGLKVAFPTLTALQIAQLLTQTFGKDETTPQTLAKQCFRTGKTGHECGQELSLNFPNASALTIGKAMADAGYSHSQTGFGIKAYAPEITAREVGSLLTQIFGKEETTTQTLAEQAYSTGKSGKECGEILHQHDSNKKLDDVASSMANAGYDQKQTAQGLKAYKASIKALELARLIKHYF